MKSSPALILAVLSGFLLSASCKKHVVTPQSELSKLPPATRTGADTFGCLVNGQAFLPGGAGFGRSSMQCNYIYTAGGYYFTILTTHQNYNNDVQQVEIDADSLAISEGEILPLKLFSTGNADASYSLITNGVNRYFTNNLVSGQLTITRFDHVNQIASGTFYFNAIGVAGDTVKVTDGRFDMHYTR